MSAKTNVWGEKRIVSLNEKFPNLDQETIAILSEMTGGDPFDITAIPISEARGIATEFLSMVGGSWTPPDCAAQSIKLKGGHSAVLIEPQSRPQKAAPLVIWYHGGGWVFGSAELHEPYGKEYAHRAGCVLAEVDYPLSPETSGRELIEACTQSALELISRFTETSAGFFGWGRTKRPVVIGGESAGATLAMFVASKLGSALVDKVVVANPLVDFRRNVDYASRTRFADDAIMQDWSEFDWFIDQFAPEAKRQDLSIISHVSHDFPEIVILLGEYDMLLDEGEAFARALRAAGGRCESRTIPGAIHNTIEFGPVTPGGIAFIEAIAEELKVPATTRKTKSLPTSSMLIR